MIGDLSMRPARAEDREAVSALCVHIWDGEDYIPAVFDDWVADPRGEFTVVYEGTHLVALGKLTELAPDEWWLEGLRVHPDFRGRGFARSLHEHAVALADRTASGVLRFATSGHNSPVHALAQRTGFSLVSHYLHQVRATTPPHPESHGFWVADAGELSALRGWLTDSGNFAAVAGLYEEQWSWSSLMPQLESLVKARRVAWWRDRDERRAGLVVYSVGEVDGDQRYWINYADTATERLVRFWRQLRDVASEQGADSLRAKPMATLPVVAALESAGWQVEPDHTMWVYARRLAEPARA